MSIACRSALSALEQTKISHPGLALHRYLPSTEDNHESAVQLLDKVTDCSPPEVYARAFEMRRHALEQRGALCARAATAGPLAIGLGNASPIEIGITLHHTFGTPIIPGAALKGLCRRGAGEMLKEGLITQTQFDAIFGSTESASLLVFHDALAVPEAKNLLQRDVITVHHQSYYSTRGSIAPTDAEDPIPVPFLVVRPEVTFLFAVEAPEDAWARFTLHLLEWCLQNLGAGAKTNAGYGRFNKMEMPPESEPEAVSVTIRGLLIRRQNGSHLEYRVIADTYDQAVEGDWGMSPIRKMLTEEESKLLKKKNQLAVQVTLEIKGSSVTLLSVDRITEN